MEPFGTKKYTNFLFSRWSCAGKRGKAMGSIHRRKSSSSRSMTKESRSLLVGHPVRFSRFTFQDLNLCYLLKLTKQVLCFLMGCWHLILSVDGLIKNVWITSSLNIIVKLHVQISMLTIDTDKQIKYSWIKKKVYNKKDCHLLVIIAVH